MKCVHKSQLFFLNLTCSELRLAGDSDKWLVLRMYRQQYSLWKRDPHFQTWCCKISCIECKCGRNDGQNFIIRAPITILLLLEDSCCHYFAKYCSYQSIQQVSSVRNSVQTVLLLLENLHRMVQYHAHNIQLRYFICNFVFGTGCNIKLQTVSL